MASKQFGAYLKARRAQLDPAAVNLPDTGVPAGAGVAARRGRNAGRGGMSVIYPIKTDLPHVIAQQPNSQAGMASGSDQILAPGDSNGRRVGNQGRSSSPGMEG
ncbi:hypothetical protein [Nocardia asteroides]|uniref:hypothetical protein n=1 Tax=Nocardia asteroides TaxID=1824 RepID=UPI001E616E09|nr:hypothetical protein [Nocardia asteroides]UGT62117.1 hypothetical protein LTT61_01815 [Nocardia asteroides]